VSQRIRGVKLKCPSGKFATPWQRHNSPGAKATEKCQRSLNPGHNATGQNATEKMSQTKCHPESERPDKMPLSYFA